MSDIAQSQSDALLRPDNDLSALTRYGVSEELIGLLDCIAESEGINGPRYPDQKSRFEFKRVLLCRNYGPPLWWLSHLLIAVELSQSAESTGSAMLDFFWVRDIVNSARCARAFECDYEFEGGSIQCRDRLVIRYPDGEFALALNKLPLLSALLEFVVYIDPSIDQQVKSLAETPTAASVDRFSRQLQSRVNTYLNDHLQVQQQKDKGRFMLDWFQQRFGGISLANHITDQSLMDFWLDVGHVEGGNFKLFNSVVDAVAALLLALSVGRDMQQKEQALSIGSGEEEGQLALDRLVQTLSPQETPQPVSRLKQASGGTIKFLIEKDLDTLSVLEEASSWREQLPLSLLRKYRFGQQQVRIGQRLRKKTVDVAKLREAIGCADIEGYLAFVGELESMVEKIDQAQSAIAYMLMQSQPTLGAGMLLERLSEPELAQVRALLNLDADCSDIKTRQVLDQLSGRLSELALQIPGLNAIMRSAKQSFESINRRGFTAMPGEDELDQYWHGYEALTELKSLITRCIRHWQQIGSDQPDQEMSLDINFRSDLSIFKNRFKTLYGEFL